MVKYRWIALCSLLSCATAMANDLLLVSGVNYAPLVGQHLPGGGLLTQVVQAALKEQGLSSRLDWHPWNRGHIWALRGDYDATFPYQRSAQREADFLYSQPLYTNRDYLFSRADEPVEFDGLYRHGRLRLAGICRRRSSVVWVRRGEDLHCEKWTDLEGHSGGSLVNNSHGQQFDDFTRDNLRFEEVPSVK